MRITRRDASAGLLALSLAFGAAAADRPADAARRGIDAVITGIVAGDTGGKAQRNALVLVHDARTGWRHASAAGIARADSGEAMTADRPFYIASITKPMVAARILQLVEAGRISLDTTLAQAGILAPGALAVLQVHEGRSHGGEITIRQLLQHRSGLRDVLLDDREHTSGELESGIAPGSIGGIWMSQLERLVACRQQADACGSEEQQRLYPGRRWQVWDATAWQRDPTDRDAGLINFFLAEMGSAGLSVPGTAFHYADTNYILLGLVIEQLTGQSLHAQLRDHVFRPLGMRHSYLSYPPDREAPPPGPAPADFWIGDLAVVSSDVDLSFDWAGGGVVSTAADLERFLRGIASGKLFRRKATRDAMLDCVPLESTHGPAGGYGLGIRCLESDYGPLWGHMGAWGAVMLMFPKHAVSVTGTVSRMSDNEGMQALVFDSMAALAAAGLLRDARR